MKLTIFQYMIIFNMFNTVKYITAGLVQHKTKHKCQARFSLSADDYSNLMEHQTKSVLFGPADVNSPEVIESDPSPHKHIFGLNKCCDKKDKPCRRVQKRSLKREYKKHISGAATFQNAVCQMKFEINRDKNRIPENIMEAKCSCPFPVNFKPRKHVCESVVQYMTVFIRTGCHNETSQYERAIEKVSVACILVKEPKKTKPKKTRIAMDE